MSNHLRAFVRYNNNGKVVPSGMVFAAHPPKTGKWKEIPITFCCSTTPFPTVSSNNKELKAYVRYDGQNKLVPGGPILSRSKPKVGNWVEINDNLCCQPSSAKCGAPYFINHLERSLKPISNPNLEFPGTSCIDNNCNIITGYNLGVEYPSGTSQIYQAVIIKYDKDGNTLWQKLQQIERPWDAMFAGPNVTIGTISVDSNNDIYICDNFSLYKLSGVDGSLLWFKALYYINIIPPPFSYGTLQYNTSMYVNVNDELYLCFKNTSDQTFNAACSGIQPDFAVTLVKLDPTTGNSLVEKTIRISDTVNYIEGKTNCYMPITGDSNGNIYMSAYFYMCYENTPGTYIYPGLNNTMKFDSNLNYISNFQFNLDPGFNVFPLVGLALYLDFYNLHLDKANNFYFNGWGNTSSGIGPFFFYRTKVNSNYNLQWCKKFEYVGTTPFNYFDFSQSIADSDGNSYILATDYRSIGHLIKIDPNGNLLWATEITDSTGDTYLFYNLWYNNPNQLSISEDTITMILGTIDSTIPDTKALFIKYPKDQQLLGTYGTTTFTDVTSDYNTSSFTPLLKSVAIDVASTNYYTPNLTPYLYSVVAAANYTITTTPI